MPGLFRSVRMLVPRHSLDRFVLDVDEVWQHVFGFELVERFFADYAQSHSGIGGLWWGLENVWTYMLAEYHFLWNFSSSERVSRPFSFGSSIKVFLEPVPNLE